MPTPQEYLESLEQRRGTSQASGGRLVAKKSDKQSRVGKFVKFATDPLIDVPDIPFAPGALNRGIESATSPLGLVGTVLAPITGGTSAGLASILAREALVSVLAGTAAEQTAEFSSKYKGPGSGILQIAAPIGAALATGRVSSRGLGAAKTPTARIKELDAADLLTDPATIVDDGEKIAYYIRNANRVMDATNKVLRAPDRAQRIGKVAAVQAEQGFTRESLKSAASELGGRYATARFVAPGTQLNETELLGALSKIKDAPLRPLERFNVQGALINVFDNGVMPTPYEAKLLAKVYGDDFVTSIMKHQTKSEKWREAAYDLIGLPRALRASSDMSAPLRQGLILGAGHPATFVKSIGPMVRAFFSEDYAKKTLETMKADPYYKPMVDSGLDMTDLSNLSLGANTEEMFMRAPKYLANTPLGALVKASERAYTIFLDKLRFDTGKSIFKHAETMGDTATKTKALEDALGFINYASGRGDLPLDLARHSPALSAALFAPRYLWSRIAVPGAVAKRTMQVARENPGMFKDPAKAAMIYADDIVMREMARDLGAFIALGTGVLATAQLGPWGDKFDVQLNPRSSDFGKLKIGNTRVEFWAGYQPIVRYMAQLLTGEQLSESGRVSPANRWETVGKFARSKEAPILGLLHDFYAGQTFMGDELRGDEVDVATQLANAFTPLFISDVMNNIKESGGVYGTATTAPAFFGLGVQTYSSVRARQNEVAKEIFGKGSYKELTAAQQDIVNTDTRVVAKEEAALGKKNDYGEATREIEQWRLDSEAQAYVAMLTGRMDVQDFADELGGIQKRARSYKDQVAEDFDVTFPAPTTPLAKVLDGWYDLYRQADYGAVDGKESGMIDWNLYNSLEKQYLNGLTAEEKNFIKERRRAQHNNYVNWFYDARDYINESEYYDLVEKEFSRFQSQANSIVPGVKTLGDLEVEENLARQSDPALYERIKTLRSRISSAADKKKEALRRRDAKLDWALYETGGTTVRLNKSTTESPFKRLTY